MIFKFEKITIWQKAMDFGEKYSSIGSEIPEL